jgi:myo-inositol 2-dehydrogenase/D-chiro-inositol 1-dehydrogenase
MRVVDPAHVALAEQLATLGELQYLRCSHRNTNADARPPKVVLVQSLIHDLHTIRWLGGEIIDVDARTVPRPGGLLHVLLVLRLASGATATVEFSDDTYAYEVEVEATAGRGMVATSAPQRPRLRVDGDHRTPIGLDWFGWFADAYRIQDRRWVTSLDDPEATGPSAFDGLAAQVVAEAAMTSLALGGPALVPELQIPEVYTR